MSSQGTEALQRSIERMLTEANTRLTIGKNLEASRSYHKAAQFADQLIEILEDADAKRSMTVRAASTGNRSAVWHH
jgi:hypothetical protein